MRPSPRHFALLATLLATTPAAARNVLLFVPDGLRADMVDPQHAPAMAKLASAGVHFLNSHAVFPTFTTPNASAMATGHYLGDTGDFSNTIYTGYPVPYANGSVTPFIENDQILGDIDSRFVGEIKDEHGKTFPVGFVDEETILAAARAAGLHTAAIGKLGPVTIFDGANTGLVQGDAHDGRGEGTIIIDDRTGSPAGEPLPADLTAQVGAAPGRGANGSPGNNKTAGTKVANTGQQDYFVRMATDIVLPRFKADGKPFALVFWSRDPDGTQHFEGDSLNTITPGINGPTSLAGIANADDDLARLIAALDRLGLLADTDIVVSADHGFSTIAKTSGPGFTRSKTSYAATQTYQAWRGAADAKALAQEVETGFLPPGFLAIDLAHELGLPLHDPDGALASAAKPITQTAYPLVDAAAPPAEDGSRVQRPFAGDGVLGDPAKPDVVVAANGGSDLIYLPNPQTAKALAGKIVTMLLHQDYVSGIFVGNALGNFPGTLSLSAANLEGSALTPIPSIAVNFASYSTKGQGCVFDSDELCTVEIADTGLQQGQGMHGSFSRADTHNFQAAIGPDFKTSYEDRLPSSNADIGMTIAALLHLDLRGHGHLYGRKLTETMPNGATPAAAPMFVRSAPDKEGHATLLLGQHIGDTRYFDAAGFPGHSVGLPAK